jgi:hypothetical protein
VSARQLFKGPLCDLDLTTSSGLENDGGDDGNASDASSCLKAFSSEPTSSLFE